MHKRLRYFFRYISRSRRLRQLFNTQGLLVLLLAVVLLSLLSVVTPSEQNTNQLAAAALQTTTPDPAAGPTRTPLPEEYLTNSQVTIGITIGAAILVLIVIFGVITFLPNSSE